MAFNAARAAARLPSRMAAARRWMSAEPVTEGLKLNIAVPNTTLVSDAVVKRVTVPGRGGTFGVQQDSPTLLSELQPGVVHVDYLDGASKEYFVPGGFAFVHKGSKCSITVPEGVELDQIDTDFLREAYQAASNAKDAAAAGTPEATKAAVELEVYKALGHALKVSL